MRQFDARMSEMESEQMRMAAVPKKLDREEEVGIKASRQCFMVTKITVTFHNEIDGKRFHQQRVESKRSMYAVTGQHSDDNEHW